MGKHVSVDNGRQIYTHNTGHPLWKYVLFHGIYPLNLAICIVFVAKSMKLLAFQSMWINSF